MPAERGNHDLYLVSAVITTYKRSANIVRRALESVINQTHKNIEIFVINDYPEDENLAEELRKMIRTISDKRIHYIVHRKNMGACAARNTGIEASNGDFIGFLDDDDEWLPQKIEMLLTGFVNEKVGIVYSPFINVTRDLKAKVTTRGTKSGDLSKEILYRNCIGGASMPLIRRRVFHMVGMFDVMLPASQDYDIYMRILQEYEAVFINEPLTRRNMMMGSITSDFMRTQRGWDIFTEKHANLYQKNLNALNLRLCERVKKFIMQGMFKEAVQLYKKALKIKLISKNNIIEPIKGLFKYLYEQIRDQTP